MEIEKEGGAQGREGQAPRVVAGEVRVGGLGHRIALVVDEARRRRPARGDLARADSPPAPRSRRRASGEAARSMDEAILAERGPLARRPAGCGAGSAGAAARATLPGAGAERMGAELARAAAARSRPRRESRARRSGARANHRPAPLPPNLNTGLQSKEWLVASTMSEKERRRIL